MGMNRMGDGFGETVHETERIVSETRSRQLSEGGMRSSPKQDPRICSGF